MKTLIMLFLTLLLFTTCGIDNNENPVAIDTFDKKVQPMADADNSFTLEALEIEWALGSDFIAITVLDEFLLVRSREFYITVKHENSPYPLIFYVGPSISANYALLNHSNSPVEYVMVHAIQGD